MSEANIATSEDLRKDLRKLALSPYVLYPYQMLKFTVNAKIPGGRGRAGTIETAHGIIQTPAFIPVATKATIKSLNDY